MGQYYKGKKIGTCENMYYIRMEFAKKRAEVGGRDDDGITFAEMLIDDATRFRFPFPEEDHLANDIIDSPTTPSVKFGIGSIEVEHVEMCISSNSRNLSNVNIFLPCLHSKAFKNLLQIIQTSPIPECEVSILFQAMRNGKEKTIFGCVRCDAQQWFEDKEIEELKAYFIDSIKHRNQENRNSPDEQLQQEYERLMEIISRIK